MASNEEKLSKIFSETFQVKRLCKQIQDLKQLREKGTFEIRMTLLKNECLVFKVQVAASAFKNSKLPDHLKVGQDFKLMIRNSYPANPPRLYFMSDNMSKFGLKPFRDYMPELLSTMGEWSAKITSQQIIKSIPNFLELYHANKVPLKNNNKQPVILQYFQVDSLFSWKFSQTHPIRLLKRNANKNKQGFLYIDIFSSEIVFLEQTGMQASYAICDYVRGQEIQSLRKKKNTPNIFMMEIKFNYPGMNGRYGIEFSSQDSESILIGVLDCVKLTENERKTSEGQIKNTESSESQQDPDEPLKADKKPKARPINQNAKIEEILEQILIVQSLVENKMTSENLSHFVTLLQKAIEYYSANNDKTFNLYLNKMQNILSNEMAQALLESATEQKKKKQEGPTERKHKEQEYQSIVDLI